MCEGRKIAIIGAGKVGTALGVLAERAGRQVVAVADVNPVAARNAARRIGGQAVSVSAEEAAGSAGLVLLTVPDDAIAETCRALVQADAPAKGTVLAHCSGALGSEILSPARDECACFIGSMHPLQTFANVESAITKLPGAYFFCEGDELAAAELTALAETLGGKTVRIEPRAKALYHAAAVMACNYLTALLDAAEKLAESAGMDGRGFLDALAPLARATVDNVLAMGPAAALTGPIERGDIETIRRHLDAMKDQPAALMNFYRAAGAWTCDLAWRKGTDRSALEKIKKLLARS